MCGPRQAVGDVGRACRSRRQVRANVYILDRSPLGVHSISMDQTDCMGCPENLG